MSEPSFEEAKQDFLDKIAKLETLGTADAVAMEMEAQGIKAKRRCPTTCVIAQYLGNDSSLVDGPDLESRSDSVIRVGGINATLHRSYSMDFESVELPEHVRAFIDRFDMGMYPNLEIGK